MWTTRTQSPSDTWTGVVEPLPTGHWPSPGGGGTPVQSGLLLPGPDLSSLWRQQWRAVVYICVRGRHLLCCSGPGRVPIVCREQFWVNLCCQSIWNSKCHQMQCTQSMQVSSYRSPTCSTFYNQTRTFCFDLVCSELSLVLHIRFMIFNEDNDFMMKLGKMCLYIWLYVIWFWLDACFVAGEEGEAHHRQKRGPVLSEIWWPWVCKPYRFWKHYNYYYLIIITLICYFNF